MTMGGQNEEGLNGVRASNWVVATTLDAIAGAGEGGAMTSGGGDSVNAASPDIVFVNNTIANLARCWMGAEDNNDGDFNPVRAILSLMMPPMFGGVNRDNINDDEEELVACKSLPFRF